MTAVGGTPLINAEHGSGATGSSNAEGMPDLNALTQMIQTMQAEITRLHSMVGSSVPIGTATNGSLAGGSGLNSRDFKRVSAFDGDPKQYRDWKFDLFVSIGQIDNRLATELQNLLSRKDRAVSAGIDFKPESWAPEVDGDLSLPVYHKYSADLYGTLVLLTTGEAKSVLRSMTDSGLPQCGYAALLLLDQRFESRTSASLLASYLEVVTPATLKTSELVSGIHQWETKVAALNKRYNESLGSNLKLAILVGMLPGSFRDSVFQNGHMMTKMTYESARDFVLNLAKQRAQVQRPEPMDLNHLWTHESGTAFQKEST